VGIKDCHVRQVPLYIDKTARNYRPILWTLSAAVQPSVFCSCHLGTLQTNGSLLLREVRATLTTVSTRARLINQRDANLLPGLSVASAGTLPKAVFALLASTPFRGLRFLCLQYGPGNSCVAWTESKWACHNIPTTLHRFFKEISRPQKAFKTNGEFRGGHPTQITWHPDGTFFVIGLATQGEEVATAPKYHVWEFASDAINHGWRQLWQTPQGGEPYRSEVTKLAVSIGTPISKTSC
jgi:hypothetical protein